MAEFAPGPRQPYPIGDLDNGQVVQARKAFSTKSRNFQWIGYEARTVSSTAIPLTTNINFVTNADFAVLTVETNPINFTLDATTLPTSSVGHNALAGAMIELDNPWEIDHFRMIRSGGADATVKVSYGEWTEE